jgi:hypothetical protein
MANTFRITGNFYVSKAGNDANDGLTPENAKATINGGLNLISANGQILVIGAGMYEETINKTTTFSAIIRADGEVKLRGNGNNIFTLSGATINFNNITFENYLGVYCSNNSVFNNCTFVNNGTVGWSASSSTTLNYNYCKFINVTNITTNQGTNAGSGVVINYCIFINCTAYVVSCNNSYFNSASSLRWRNPTGFNMDYNNIMCPIYIFGTAYPDLASQVSAQPTYNSNSINQNPKFNNVAKFDFTLQYDSPHLLRAGDGLTNIGGTNYAVTSVFATGAEWSINNPLSERVNIDQSGQDAVIKNGQTSGYVASAPWKAFGNPTEIMQIAYNGVLLYNKSAAGGSPSNNNVPDANVFAGADANGSGNPDRLSIEMRWSTSDEMPAQNSDWTNGNYGATGEWYKFEINQQPKLYFNAVENKYYGNGSASYQIGTAFTFPVVWVQFRITLTNLYINQ